MFENPSTQKGANSVNLHRRSGSPPGKRSLNRAPHQVNLGESTSRGPIGSAENKPVGFSESGPVAFASRLQVGRHRRSWREPWLCLAERVLGGWAPTLRAAVLLLVFAVCLLGLAAAVLGVIGVAACVVGFAVVWLLPERLFRRFIF
jgi:hypothetical protein